MRHNAGKFVLLIADAVTVRGSARGHTIGLSEPFAMRLIFLFPRSPRMAVLLALALIYATGVGPVFAQSGSEEIFTIRGIALDETADTAAAARNAALRKGQRQALAALVRRLTVRADHARFPELNDERLEFLVQSLQIDDEKTSDVRYLAQLTVVFKSREVRRVFHESGIAFAETPSKPVLVLPVLRRAGVLLLWDDPNEWRQAWSSLPPQDGLVPLVAPVGDLADIADISAEQAANGDRDRLAAIADRYGAGDVLVALATFSFDSASRLHLNIAATRIGTSSQPPLLLDFAAPANTPFALLAGDAVAGVVGGVEDAWKQANTIRFDRSHELIVAVPVGSLESWVSVEQRLGAVASIAQVQLRALTRDSATVSIIHFGDQAQLAEALAQQDLLLEAPLTQATSDAFLRGVTARVDEPMRVLRPAR